MYNTYNMLVFSQLSGNSKKFCSKIQILVKNPKLVKNLKFWSKIQILVKNQNFVQKYKSPSKIKILVKNPNFDQKSEFQTKIQIWPYFTKNFWYFPNLHSIIRKYSVQKIFKKNYIFKLFPTVHNYYFIYFRLNLALEEQKKKRWRP